MEKYGIKNKSSKQCRERWYNSLCPNINKGNWNEKEEKILFYTQLKIGNKWSILSKLLPGRTENDIKNHFYSKLRKYLRKICKEIKNSELLERKRINSSYYSSNTIYKLIQKENIPLVILSKNSIIDIIEKDYLNKKAKLIQKFNLNKFENSTQANTNMINESLKNNEMINNNFKLRGIILDNINNKNNNEINDTNYAIFNELYSDNSKNEFNIFNYKGEFSPPKNLKKKRKEINIFEELLKEE